jgi:hypothetical protein
MILGGFLYSALILGSLANLNKEALKGNHNKNLTPQGLFAFKQYKHVCLTLPIFEPVQDLTIATPKESTNTTEENPSARKSNFSLEASKKLKTKVPTKKYPFRATGKPVVANQEMIFTPAPKPEISLKGYLFYVFFHSEKLN